MDRFGLPQDAWTRMDARPRIEYEFLTHDQRTGDACELAFEDLDARERAIYLRCGFQAPRAA